MRTWRWLPIVVVLVLLLGLAPASAEEKPVITDKGRNVYVVDGNKGDLNNLLPSADVEKIQRLQTESTSVGIISPVSPDDQAVFAAMGESLGFLNVEDGTFEALDERRLFAHFVPIVSLLGITPWGWRDERTLVGVGIEIVDRQNNQFNPALVTIDRFSGRVDGAALPDKVLETLPVSLAPNGSRALFLELPKDQADATPGVAQAQISWPHAAAMPARGLPAALQGRVEAFAQGLAYGRMLLKLKPLLAPNDGEMAATSDNTKLLLYDLGEDDLRELHSFAPGTLGIGFAWSQDAARLAASFTSALDYRKDPGPRERRRPFDGALLSEQVYRDVTGNLPPGENPLLQNNTVELFDLNDGGRKTLRAADGDGQMLSGVSWSTDGQTLLVQAYQPGRLLGRRYPIYTPQFHERVSFRFYNLDLRELSRFEAPQLASVYFTQGEFVTPDEVIFTALVGTNIQPYYYNRVSGEFRDLADRSGIYVTIVPTRRSRQIVFVYTSFTDPPDLYRLNWDGTALSRLTWANEELRRFSKTRQDPVSFRLANGQTRSGVLIQPADAPFPPKNAPIVVWQEGGPGFPMLNFWAANVENPYALLPNFGFGVLVVPLAGRHGLGPRVYSALYDRANFGQVDIDEQAQIVRQMIARRWTAKGKVGITGCSYGGYFTLQSLVRNPDLYAAANAQCAVVDNIVEWSRGYAALMPYLQGLPPWSADAEYRRDSPLYNAGRIKTPLLTFHGANDFLPITLNENLHLQLVNRNVPAKMLEFVGAGHGLGNKDYQRYAAQEQILWFRQYLK